jgi:hypothetical protein
MLERNPPPVWTWERVWCAFMAFLYLACSLAGGALLIFKDQIADSRHPADELLFQAILLILVGLPLAALYLAGVFLPPRPWVWVFHIVLIGIGMTSCCLLPATIPLLLAWIRPETRAWLGCDTPGGKP